MAKFYKITIYSSYAVAISQKKLCPSVAQKILNHFANVCSYCKRIVSNKSREFWSDGWIIKSERLGSWKKREAISGNWYAYGYICYFKSEYGLFSLKNKKINISTLYTSLLNSKWGGDRIKLNRVHSVS